MIQRGNLNSTISKRRSKDPHILPSKSTEIEIYRRPPEALLKPTRFELYHAFCYRIHFFLKEKLPSGSLPVLTFSYNCLNFLFVSALTISQHLATFILFVEAPWCNGSVGANPRLHLVEVTLPSLAPMGTRLFDHRPYLSLYHLSPVEEVGNSGDFGPFAECWQIFDRHIPGMGF